MSQQQHLKKSANVSQVGGEVGVHSYTQEETEAFTDYINSVLQDDPHLSGVMPIPPDGLFEAVKNGVLLCKLINVAIPGTIDERVINLKANNNPWQRSENHTLAINSAQGIGCSVVNIQPEFLSEGRPHIVLGLVWQIIKIGLLADINLKEHPELVRLLNDGEELSDLLKLSPEQILIRWVNYHLKEAKSDRRIGNFTSDIKDSVVYTTLLKQICPNNECDMSPLNESDLEKRADKMLNEADKLGCRKFVRPRDVVVGNAKLNLAFVANLFNNYPALEQVNPNDYADLLDFDSEGSREEKCFKFWIQSQGLECNNLYEDLRNGAVLLQLFDKVQPGIVDWKKANLNPKNKYQAIENTNYCVQLADKLKFSTVNQSGPDIYDKNKKLILGMIWQLMRHNLLNTLKELGNGKPVSDNDVLAWANNKVGDQQISSFNDPSLKTGVFLCNLCYKISPRSVNMDLVTPGETDEDAAQNAKYAISVARKIGAAVFLLWEDIVEVKPKPIFAFTASLMKVALSQNH
jgi:plastin-1